MCMISIIDIQNFHPPSPFAHKSKWVIPIIKPVQVRAMTFAPFGMNKFIHSLSTPPILWQKEDFSKILGGTIIGSHPTFCLRLYYLSGLLVALFFIF